MGQNSICCHPSGLGLGKCIRKVSTTNFGDDDFFAQDFHGVVHAGGLLLHQDDLAECPLTQQLEVIKVAHCLWDVRTRTLSV